MPGLVVPISARFEPVNKEQLKKNIGMHVRIQPAMQVYGDRGQLEGAHDDIWTVCDATNTELVLENQWNQFRFSLGFDSYVNFVEDPEGKRSRKIDGILVLKAQIYLYDGRLQFAPTIAPGKELRDFTPPKLRPDARESARRHHEAQVREEFQRSPAGIELAKQSFSEIGDSIVELNRGFAADGTPIQIELRREGFAFLVKSCGWYVTIVWQMAQGNSLKGCLLTIVKWYGPPPWPGLIPLVKGREVTVTQYTFGLLSASNARWLSTWKPDRGYTSRDVAEQILKELIEGPNNDPVLLFDLAARRERRS